MQFVHFVLCYAEQYHEFKAYFIIAGIIVLPITEKTLQTDDIHKKMRLRDDSGKSYYREDKRQN